MYTSKSVSRRITFLLFTLVFALAFLGVAGGFAEAGRFSKLPDLIVSAMSTPSVAQPGQNLVLSASIKNLGRVSADASQTAFYLTKGKSSIADATWLGTQNVGSLPAGATLALTTTLSIPSSTSSGTFYVMAVADPSNAVQESNKANNTRVSSAITIKGSTLPTISAVNATQITVNNATITWTTDKAGTSQVEHGNTAAYGNFTPLHSSLTTSHAVALNGLTPGTVHHYRVRSQDTDGNTAYSNDYTFATPTAATPTAATPTAATPTAATPTAATPTVTTGNTYFVAPGGSDANPGTDALPFRTLARGVRVLTPGDTLYIKSGTYAEALLDSIPSGTSWDSPVTVAAAPGTVTLKPNSGAEYVLYFQGPQQYIIIDGLILDGTNVTYDAVKITTGGGSPAHHIRLIRCEIKNAPVNGVLTSWNANFNEFINLNVHDVATSGRGHAFYISTSHNVIEGSDIHHNPKYGVHVYEEDAYKGRADNNIVRNNRIYNNGAIKGFGMILSSGDGNLAYNNLIWGNGNGGIKVGYINPTNTKVYNNTVYNNGDVGIEVEPDSRTAMIQNNIVYANGGSNMHNAGSETVLDHNLVGTDPKFVNAGAGDFRVQSGSPAIDAGIAISTVTTDVAGMLRPQGGNHDVGAFETIF